ncbi:hypothetical protein HK096_009575, partial [Nowakowskiella sp. JEL0078]
TLDRHSDSHTPSHIFQVLSSFTCVTPKYFFITFTAEKWEVSIQILRNYSEKRNIWC